MTTEVKRGKAHLICFNDPRSPVAEAYRTLRTNIQFAGVNRDLRSLLITSAEPRVGKTTTLCNLGIVMAQAQQRVLLIDADLRRPMLHARLSLTNRFGLSNVLIKHLQLQDVVQERPEVPGLHAITSGPIPPNPSELLSTKEMEAILETAREQYDVVLIDSPPLLPVTDAQVLSRLVDGTLLVVNNGKTTREQLTRAKSLLDHVEGHLVGAVMNNTKAALDSYYYG